MSRQLGLGILQSLEEHSRTLSESHAFTTAGKYQEYSGEGDVWVEQQEGHDVRFHSGNHVCLYSAHEHWRRPTSRATDSWHLHSHARSLPIISREYLEFWEQLMSQLHFHTRVHTASDDAAFGAVRGSCVSCSRTFPHTLEEPRKALPPEVTSALISFRFKMHHLCYIYVWQL